MFNSDAVAGSRPDRAAHISGLYNTEQSRYTLSSPGSGRLTGNERINQCQLELRSKQKPHPESTDARCALSGVPGNKKKTHCKVLQGGSERRKRCVSEALTAFYLQPLSGVLLSSCGPPPPSRCGRRAAILGSRPRRSALIFKASLSASAPPHGPLPLLMLSFAEVGRWAGRARNCLHRFVRESLCSRCLCRCLVLAER